MLHAHLAMIHNAFHISLLWKANVNLAWYMLLPNFLPIFLINFQKKLKIIKKQWKTSKIYFWYICIVFSIFNVISKEFKISKVFWTRSTFNTLFIPQIGFKILILCNYVHGKTLIQPRIYMPFSLWSLVLNLCNLTLNWPLNFQFHPWFQLIRSL